MNPIFLADFYKCFHRDQYPEGITQVWSNWTPRKSRVPGVNSVVHFGLQYFCLKYLMGRFNQQFFSHPVHVVLKEYRDVIKATLGVDNPRTDHIEWLHNLGYLPIKIYSLPEGSSVPIGVPSLVITNTLPEGFWLPNYLETILSATLWKPSTSATTAREYRKIFKKYALESGETDLSFVDWMGHDFSFRGMSGIEDAILSGMGHLLSFSGTDTIPAILAAKQYYCADLSVGGSVPATEHSVMSAGSKDGEFETFRRLIEDIYPNGIVSIVSDTWDLWTVLTDYIPRLKDKILARDGKIVIRPDSGDPVKIICGDDDCAGLSHNYKCSTNPAFVGAALLLAQALGTNGTLINKGGLIYGDSITLERADAILRGLADSRLSPYNMVFGIGSYTYEYVTRDTYGFAMKATAVRKGGEIVPIFKDPVTCDGFKKSLRGIPAVYEGDLATDADPQYYVIDNATEQQLDNCAYRIVFEDGTLLVSENFDTIRKRARA
jgi:nicotinamide phosphoribosyltransferase